MNYVKRAWISVNRRKGKSLLLFALIFIIANVIAGAVSIQQGVRVVEKTIKTSMGDLATIVHDYDTLNEAYAENENFVMDTYVSLDTIKKIGSSPYVKYYDYNLMSVIGSETLIKYSRDPLKAEQMFGGADNYREMIKSQGFMLTGVNYHKIVDIEEKRINLVEGRVLTEEEVTGGKSVAIISKPMAEMNNLKVGDTLPLATFKSEYGENGISSSTKVTDYPLKVVGIFELPTQTIEGKSDDETKSREEANREMVKQGQLNTIYVPNKIAEAVFDEWHRIEAAQVADYEEAGYTPPTKDQLYQPLFVLNNPDDAGKFKEENQGFIPKFYKLTTSTDEYDLIAAPIEATGKIADYVLTIAILAAVLIITLVVLLFLRDRKHELGIYLSFGENRKRIFGQILFEVLFIAFAAVTISIVTGNFIAKSVSASMIQDQIEQQSNQPIQNDVVVSMNPTPLTGQSYNTDDVVAAYEVGLSPVYIFIMYVVGLGTAILATLLPLVYILRLNPKKIML